MNLNFYCNECSGRKGKTNVAADSADERVIRKRISQQF